jgi:hypothetical protein
MDTFVRSNQGGVIFTDKGGRLGTRDVRPPPLLAKIIDKHVSFGCELFSAGGGTSGKFQRGIPIVLIDYDVLKNIETLQFTGRSNRRNAWFIPARHSHCSASIMM